MLNHVRHAVIENGKVVNVILLDEVMTGTPEGIDEGHQVVASDDAQIGAVYSDGSFVNPEPICIEQIPTVTLAEQILGNPDELAKLKKALGL